MAIPGFAKNHRTDSRLGYAKLLGQLTLIDTTLGVPGTNLVSQFRCKSGIGMVTTVSHLGHVLGLRTKVQMTVHAIIANAVRHVAGMKNLKPFWYWSIRQFPGNTVNTVRLSVPADGPVPAAVEFAGPQPACFGFLDIYPKTVSEGSMADLHQTGTTKVAELPVAFGNARRIDQYRLATVKTFALNALRGGRIRTHSEPLFGSAVAPTGETVRGHFYARIIPVCLPAGACVVLP